MTVEYVGVPVPEFLTSGTSCFSAFDVLVVFQKVFKERQSEDVAADDYHSFAEGSCQHERLSVFRRQLGSPAAVFWAARTTHLSGYFGSRVPEGVKTRWFDILLGVVANASLRM